jgi:hypothetical protein|tara:strand:- start:4050 stop:4319 length:270 start_codon:yes stop_codon:yes gene_type:complete
MRIYLNGLGELALFLKQNSKTVSNELFPKSLSSFIPLLESIKKGCRCHHKMKMKSINYMFQNLVVTEEEKQNLKTLFPEGFELEGKVSV